MSGKEQSMKTKSKETIEKKVTKTCGLIDIMSCVV